MNASLEKGEKLAGKCVSCHSFKKGEPNKLTYEPFSKGASRGLLINLASFQKSLGINGGVHLPFI